MKIGGRGIERIAQIGRVVTLAHGITHVKMERALVLR